MATQEDQIRPRPLPEKDHTNAMLFGMGVSALLLAYLIVNGVDWFVAFMCHR